MLQPLSLRARLSLLLGAVLTAGLALGFGLLILHAGARVRTEAEAATRLARELVEATLPRLETAQDPRAELTKILVDARRLRHVRVALQGAEAPEPQDRRAPEWFRAFALPTPIIARIETPLKETIVIETNPADEIAEIWQEIVWLAIGGAGVAAAAFGLVSYAVSRTLRPVAALSDGLQRLERGDHSVRVPADGPPEFVAIAERINTLAATLQRLDDENRRLVRRMIHVQDEERRDIARDLHDEIGPFLFTVRAGVGALARKAASPDAEPARLAEGCARIDSQIAALQQVNRRILGRLRPAALEEMGLADALQALAQGWRETRPEVSIELSLDGARGKIDETIALTAYRFVQEGLTNAYRHSGATRVSVRATREGDSLRLEVSDNGSGLPAVRVGNGLGLRGMSERVGALGGELAITNDTQGGARLCATLPLVFGHE
ncbi:histidine kinase [Methylocystis sp. WRRC1]|uniref:histidine kinase n=1 Tax=Methylocystis sp. WRRC1 TaxID=1732014 RepID=UPI001D13AF90|nr:histidine kinase [Methylocystis sp. WRRC1]MCC3247157.1 histidine kinase [Methylocystis sp. WRRC1]